jgi:hypothetical protein
VLFFASAIAREGMKVLKKGSVKEHGVDCVLFDDHARGLVVGELRVEAEAQAREEVL